MGELFDAYVAVDWSAASKPGSARGGRDELWTAVATADGAPVVTPSRTRRAAAQELERLLVDLAQEGRRVLVGLDVVYGYPSGTAEALGFATSADEPAWRATWHHLRDAVTDEASNANNRFDVAAALNRMIGPGAGPFWGAPGERPSDSALQRTKPAFPFAAARGSRLREYRHVERALRDRGFQPKSAWQLHYTGSVGSQALVGIPYLHALRFQARLAGVSAVWPFETGFTSAGLWRPAGPSIVHAEIYPSGLPWDAAAHPVPDAAQVLGVVEVLRRFDADGRLGELFEPPSDLGVDALGEVVREEGWILGAGHDELRPRASAPAARRRPAPPPTPRAARPVVLGKLSTGGSAPATGEALRTLARLGGVRIEEIVSSSEPDHGLQEQAHDEWVVVLEGRGQLEVRGERITLEPGAWILLPAGTPHRVLGAARGTTWLALHADDEAVARASPVSTPSVAPRC